MNLSWLMYRQLVDELVRALRASRRRAGPRYRGSVVDVPRQQGQQSRGSTFWTARQADLLPRPGSPLTLAAVAPRTYALGDGRRASAQRLPSDDGFGVTPLVDHAEYPFAGVTPPVPHSFWWKPSTGENRFGENRQVPTYVFLPLNGDALMRWVGDWQDIDTRRYAGNESESPGFMDHYERHDENPRYLGANWFFAYASGHTSGGADRVVGLEVPVYFARRYWNLPDAYVGNVQTFIIPYHEAQVNFDVHKGLYAAEDADHDFIVPLCQHVLYVPEPDPVEEEDKWDTWAYYGGGSEIGGKGLSNVRWAWPVSVTRSAPLTAWSADPQKIDWPLVQYRRGETPETRLALGNTSVWRYRVTAGTDWSSLSLGVSPCPITIDENLGEIPDLSAVPSNWNRFVQLREASGGPYGDGRREFPRAHAERNILYTSGDFPTCVASSGTPAPKFIISTEFEYDHDWEDMTVRYRMGFGVYVPVSWTITPWSDGESGDAYSGDSYAFGGRITSADDPDVVNAARRERDWESALRREMTYMVGTLRVLTAHHSLTEQQMRLWWSQSTSRMIARGENDWDGLHAGNDGPSHILGREYEHLYALPGWPQTLFGHYSWAYNFKSADAPNVPTVGRFKWDDFGPVSVEGVGLRMSHQETFDDWAGSTITAGRILTFVDPGDARSYFPPTHPSPHTAGFPEGGFNGVDYDAAASLINRLMVTSLGNLNMPYGGGGTTFAGLAVDASGTYAADALVAPNGDVIGAVLDEDLQLRISVNNALAWTGHVLDVLPEGYELPQVPLPFPLYRPLFEAWPYRLLVLAVGHLRLVFRARTSVDAMAPGGAPLVLSHEGNDLGA